MMTGQEIEKLNTMKKIGGEMMFSKKKSDLTNRETTKEFVDSLSKEELETLKKLLNAFEEDLQKLIQDDGDKEKEKE